MNPLDISEQDVARLPDDELRTIVGLLCEAECRATGLPVSSVHFGGDQNAPDGGLDVVVEGLHCAANPDFLPRARVGIQVKKPKMPPGAIKNEMRPQGVLRPVLADLAKCGGAYIIVSSGDTTSFKMREDRMAAMRDAVADQTNLGTFVLDFYDASKIVVWLRKHPSVLVRARNMAGRPVHGWQSYGNWSLVPADGDCGFLHDDTERFISWVHGKECSSTVSDGLKKLRELLSVRGGVARLVGLSGAGKTRFVQSLFEKEYASEVPPLDRAGVFYADVGAGPTPTPRHFADLLNCQGTPGLLVVDNCPGLLHRELAMCCKLPGSQLRLLTIDLCADEKPPADTAFFRLDLANGNLVEDMLQQRYSQALTYHARKRIAEASGGNWRIALAVAGSVDSTGSVAQLSDEALFRLVFWRRDDEKEQLLRTAEVCSLVFSFDASHTGHRSHLAFLAGFLGGSPRSTYEVVTLLIDRGVMQARGKWRAILPDALANKLATQALRMAPALEILRQFESADDSHLEGSFFHRLSFLHDSEEAETIAREVLRTDRSLVIGVALGERSSLDNLCYLAPVVPECALALVEYAVVTLNAQWARETAGAWPQTIVVLLRKIAYEPRLFRRAVNLLAKAALNTDLDPKTECVSELCGLFQPHLSNTHAACDIRAAAAEEMLASNEIRSRELGVLLLDTALSNGHSFGKHDIVFGGRTRDYGYSLQSGPDAIQWYTSFWRLTAGVLTNVDSSGEKARRLFARKIRALLVKMRMVDEVITVVEAVRGTVIWPEAWRAVREVLRFERGSLEQHYDIKVAKLERLLAPRSIVEEVRAWVCTRGQGYYDVDDDAADDSPIQMMQKAEETARLLGQRVARDAESITTILEDVVACHGYRVHEFGSGLALGCEDLLSQWQQLFSLFESTGETSRHAAVLQGFLFGCAQRDRSLYNDILDEIFDRAAPPPELVSFEAAQPLDSAGLGRLRKALARNMADAATFSDRSAHIANADVESSKLISFLEAIWDKPGGHDAVLEIFMAISTRPGRNSWPSLTERLGMMAYVSRAVLEYSGKLGPNLETFWGFDELCQLCFDQDAEGVLVPAFLEVVREGIFERKVFAGYFATVTGMLVSRQPQLVLDLLLDDDLSYGKWSYLVADENTVSPFDMIDDELLEEWAGHSPERRWPNLASAISPWSRSLMGSGIGWRPIFYSRFTGCKDERYLAALGVNLWPTSWRGSRSVVLSERLPLIEELLGHPNELVKCWARGLKQRFSEAIAEDETEEHKTRTKFERFE